MLREIKNTLQKPDEPRKRWFSSPDMDLFVWLNDNDDIVGYHLTYDKKAQEKALTWKKDKGFTHSGVDDGSRPGKHPGSPLLTKDVSIQHYLLIRSLSKNKGDLDEDIHSFILAGIKEWKESFSN